MSSIVNHIKAYGDKITDETIVSKALRSLNKRFDSIEKPPDLSNYVFDELMSSLQAHKEKLWSVKMLCLIKMLAGTLILRILVQILNCCLLMKLFSKNLQQFLLDFKKCE